MVLSNMIQTADLHWQDIDGIEVPVSNQFGDVYFSKDNGLLETRHVFLNGNDLPERLSQLQPFEYFSVGETGFGTGLNILALWQLWHEVRPNNHSRLHVISVEKFPLSKNDLIRALNAWPELKCFADQLIAQYPHPIAGCHRLNFPESRFSLDLWLGDAQDVFPIMPKTGTVRAWFLDGFAPACNPEMWEAHVLHHIIRLSDMGTTFSSFSVAGVLKRGLKQHGISVARPRGFKHKREMLKAIWPSPLVEQSIPLEKAQAIAQDGQMPSTAASFKQQHIAIIGAGIAGLSTAWAFAQRGHQITLYDQSEPLAGASGNPLALLNPKLGPIEHSHEHLMTLAWQYALPHYAQFKAFRALEVHQLALKKAEDLLKLESQYPEGVLQSDHQADLEMPTAYPSLTLTQAGAVSPHALKDEILAHPQIHFIQAHVGQMNAQTLEICDTNARSLGQFDHVIVCCAQQSAALFKDYPALKPIRGQISWCSNTKRPLNPDQAYSYGGYCMQMNAQQLILGASFWPNRTDTDVQLDDHVHNYNLIHSVFPEYAESLPEVSLWQGRASIRAQSNDYFPCLGQVDEDSRLYTFAGLGSKGFLFAPLCCEILAAQMLGEACPAPEQLIKKMSPMRFKKKLKAKKPYFKAESEPHNQSYPRGRVNEAL